MKGTLLLNVLILKQEVTFKNVPS